MAHSLTAFMTQINPRRAVYLRNCLHFRSHYQHPVHEATSRFTSGRSVQIGRKSTLSLCHQNTRWASAHAHQHRVCDHGFWSIQVMFSTLIFLFVETRDVASKQRIHPGFWIAKQWLRWWEVIITNLDTVMIMHTGWWTVFFMFYMNVVSQIY